MLVHIHAVRLSQKPLRGGTQAGEHVHAGVVMLNKQLLSVFGFKCAP